MVVVAVVDSWVDYCTTHCVTLPPVVVAPLLNHSTPHNCCADFNAVTALTDNYRYR
jgi:hypothetical protein